MYVLYMQLYMFVNVKVVPVLLFFFFKQKTAYEMSASLVGSEMCIRDRTTGVSTLWEYITLNA